MYETLSSHILRNIDKLEQYLGVHIEPSWITPEILEALNTDSASLRESPLPESVFRGLESRESYSDNNIQTDQEVQEAIQAAFEESALRAAADQQRGYKLEEEVLPLPESALMRVRQHQMPGSNDSGAGGSIYRFFRTMADYERETGRIAPWLPNYAVPVGTESYIGPWGIDGSASIYAQSTFGAPLMITRVPVDEAKSLNPNLIIFDRNASVIWKKHSGGKWATIVSAFDGSAVYAVEVAAKLEGAQRDEFVRFATDILENRIF